MAAMSAGLAPGAIIMAMGSPGTTRNSTKTISPTPNSVTAAMATRLDNLAMAIEYSDLRLGHCLAAGLCPADEHRLHRARHARRDLQVGFVDDRLHILQQRNH